MAAQKPKVLEVILSGVHAGRVVQDRHGRLSFSYEEAYQRLSEPTPLSLSMRPTRREHPHKAVDPFLRGLLPDSQAVLDRWGSQFHVSANNPFALLAHVGEDVAGAAQFVTPERFEEASSAGSFTLVNEDYIAQRLRTLRTDRAAWADARAPSQFSLAGAQSKFALYRGADGQWAIPTGRKATTHILKPALQYLAGQDINEHLCLVAARNLGLDAAYSEVAEFDGERAIVLERYDRELVDGEVVRIHQEDFCQALSINPVDKYERGDPGQQGRGPGIVQMIETMRAVQSTEDFLSSAEHYVKALAYNWLIYAPDAHAKNYSILLDGVEVLPSPLYDISSVLPYPGAGEHEFELRTMATAISVNGKYQNNLILGSDWLALADKLRLDRNKVIGWVRDIAEQVPDAFSDAAESNRQFVGTSSVVTKLVDGVARYTQALRENIAEC